MGAYQNPDDAARLRNAFRSAGKKIDMGKSCLRFRRVEDLPLDVIGRLIKGTPPEKFIKRYESIRKISRKAKPKAKSASS